MIHLGQKAWNWEVNYESLRSRWISRTDRGRVVGILFCIGMLTVESWLCCFCSLDFPKPGSWSSTGRLARVETLWPSQEASKIGDLDITLIPPKREACGKCLGSQSLLHLSKFAAHHCTLHRANCIALFAYYSDISTSLGLSLVSAVSVIRRYLVAAVLWTHPTSMPACPSCFAAMLTQMLKIRHSLRIDQDQMRVSRLDAPTATGHRPLAYWFGGTILKWWFWAFSSS
jgi:hypothetical protein